MPSKPKGLTDKQMTEVIQARREGKPLPAGVVYRPGKKVRYVSTEEAAFATEHGYDHPDTASRMEAERKAVASAVEDAAKEAEARAQQGRSAFPATTPASQEAAAGGAVDADQGVGAGSATQTRRTTGGTTASRS